MTGGCVACVPCRSVAGKPGLVAEVVFFCLGFTARGYCGARWFLGVVRALVLLYKLRPMRQLAVRGQINLEWRE
jgi:hypothetical protein